MTIYSGFSYWKRWFSIVMLVYQRVHHQIWRYHPIFGQWSRLPTMFFRRLKPPTILCIYDLCIDIRYGWYSVSFVLGDTATLSNRPGSMDRPSMPLGNRFSTIKIDEVPYCKINPFPILLVMYVSFSHYMPWSPYKMVGCVITIGIRYTHILSISYFILSKEV